MSATEPTTAELDQNGLALATDAQAVQIKDAATFQLAADWLKRIKAYLQRVAEVFDPIDAAQIAARKTTIAQRTRLEAHAKAAERVIKDRMAAFEREQDRIRREAEEKARQERARLEAEEKARVEAERQRLRKEADEKRLQEALAAEQRGDTQAAEKLLEAPVVVPTVAPRPVFVPPAPAVAVPKVEGVSFRDEWSAEVFDLLALVQAVAAGTQPLHLVKADQVALNAIARSLRDSMNIPGVKADKKRGVAARG